MKKSKKGGFEYYLEKEKIEEYSRWTTEEKLRWLSAANKFRRCYPKEIIESHEKFRKGEI